MSTATANLHSRYGGHRCDPRTLAPGLWCVGQNTLAPVVSGLAPVCLRKTNASSTALESCVPAVCTRPTTSSQKDSTLPRPLARQSARPRRPRSKRERSCVCAPSNASCIASCIGLNFSWLALKGFVATISEARTFNASATFLELPTSTSENGAANLSPFLTPFFVFRMSTTRVPTVVGFCPSRDRAEKTSS